MDISENELLEELVQAVKAASGPRATRLPGDVTAADIARHSGQPLKLVQRILGEKIKAGELRRVWVICEDGSRTLVYRRAE